MKNSSFSIIANFLCMIAIPFASFSSNTITFSTTEQSFGVIDLDYFEITTDTFAGGTIYEGEYPSGATVGFPIPRGNASNLHVWGQLGAEEGAVWYNNIPGNGQYFIRIRYSRNHFLDAPPVQIYVNNELQGSLTPQNTGNWNAFQTSSWLIIEFPPAASGIAFYHPFQNFDDDVDRIKKFSNFFTGSSGIIGDTTLVTLNYNSEVTRTGYGRSLEIVYDSLDDYAVYVESFIRDWFDNNALFDLNDLFPEFLGSGFENRQIDSIVFYYRLEAENPLSMQLEVSDGDMNKGIYTIELSELSGWQRIAVAICDFETLPNEPPFDPSKAKFLGFTFADYVGGQSVNLNETGTLFLDDIFLVENDFEKPIFTNNDDLLDYLNKVRFRFFWEAVDPTSFFIFDRHLWDDLISVDGIGWQLSTYTIAHRNEWLAPQIIENRTEQILYNLLYKCQHTNNPDSAIAHPLRYASVKGNWAHFLNSGDLKRKNANTEYSLFTNALLLSGVIVARQYFEDKPSIVAKADSIIAMTDWNFLYDEVDSLMHFHWAPESGLSSNKTDWFSEELDLAFLLGISSPVVENQLPVNPFFANGYRRPLDTDDDYIFSAPGTGFTYWFLQMYAQFEEHTQRFKNTQNAILNDIKVEQNELGDFMLIYDSRIFGITACEGPDSAGFYLDDFLDTIFISNYHAYGYCSKFDTNNDPNGTIAVYGGLSTILFTPDKALDLVNYYYDELDSIFRNDYEYAFWSPIFGFPDAFHLNPDSSFDTLINSLGFNGPWLSVPRFAIDVGPMLINTDSYLAEKGFYSGNSIRTLFSSYPPIQAQLHHFDTIEVHNMPEAIEIVAEISPDTCLMINEEVLFTATITNEGNFAYEYEWLINGALIEVTSTPSFTINASAFGNGDVLSCKLLIPMANCDFSLFATNELEICKQPTKVNNISTLESFNASPNPTSNNLNINIEFHSEQMAMLKLSSLWGQIIFKKEYEEQSLSETLDLSNYPRGVYLLSLIVDGNIATRKIIKS